MRSAARMTRGRAMTALRGILTRSVTTLITLFGVAVIVFVVIRVAPGNPIAMMLPPGASEADIDRLRALYGLDKSIPEQFFIWLGNVLAGRFRHVDLDPPQRALDRAEPAAGDAGAEPSRAAHRRRRSARRFAFVATRWRETHGGDRRRRRQRHRAFRAGFPLGPGADPGARRRLAGVRDFRPRLAAARSPLRHAVLPDREPASAPLRHHRRPARPHARCRRWRWRCRSPPSSRSC